MNEVTTRAELDALPEESVVMWRDGPDWRVARKPSSSEYPHAVSGFWEQAGTELGTTSEDIIEYGHAVKVLHKPNGGTHERP